MRDNDIKVDVAAVGHYYIRQRKGLGYGGLSVQSMSAFPFMRSMPLPISIQCSRPFSAAASKKMKVFKPDLTAIYVSRKADFQRWKSEIALRLKGTEGPCFLGDKVPFPYNPSFQPAPALSNSTRNHIFATWLSDKKKWTPRALSAAFKVSIERIEAILRQKCVEKQSLEEKQRLFHSYASKMDLVLGAGREDRPVDEGDMHVIKLPPKLIAIPENSTMSSEEAACLLDRKLYVRKDVVKKEIERTRPLLDPLNGVKLKSTVENEGNMDKIGRSREEASRWRYFIYNISVKSTELLIRERNGILRHASPEERILEMSSGKAKSSTRVAL